MHLRAERLGNISRQRCRGKKSSPYAVLEKMTDDGSTSQFVEVGRTEVIHSNLCPVWATALVVDHDEDRNWTQLRITLYDCRKSEINEGSHAGDTASLLAKPERMLKSVIGLTKGEDPSMGEVNVEVGGILGSEAQEEEHDLDRGGSLFVHITESIEGNDHGEFHCQLRGLDFKNIEAGWLGLGAIDPYYELSKKYLTKGGMTRWQLVHRSEHISNVVNPHWSPFSLSLEKLCNCDARKALKLTVFDYEERKSHRVIGEVLVSLDELRDSVTVGGNASRLRALAIRSDEGEDDEEEVGLLVVLKADVLQ